MKCLIHSFGVYIARCYHNLAMYIHAAFGYQKVYLYHTLLYINMTYTFIRGVHYIWTAYRYATNNIMQYIHVIVKDTSKYTHVSIFIYMYMP